MLYCDCNKIFCLDPLTHEMENMEKKWLSVDETCEYLGVKRDTIYRWIDKRGLPSYRIGRLLKFRMEELDEWVKQGRIESEDKKTAGLSK